MLSLVHLVHVGFQACAKNGKLFSPMEHFTLPSLDLILSYADGTLPSLAGSTRSNSIVMELSRDSSLAFVVCGYSKRAGLDYDRTFSATLRASSFRVLLSLAAGKKMQLRQFDVSNAFTQAFMDDTVLYIEPPKGFEEWEIVNHEHAVLCVGDLTARQVEVPVQPVHLRCVGVMSATPLGEVGQSASVTRTKARARG